MTTNFFFASFQDNFQRLIRFLLDSIAFVYAWFFYPDRKNELPPIKNKILLRSAIELADDIRTGQLTSEQVVQVYLDRIKEVNKLTNSIVHINPLALEEARKIDQLIRNTKDKRKLEKLSLIGVPFTGTYVHLLKNSYRCLILVQFYCAFYSQRFGLHSGYESDGWSCVTFRRIGHSWLAF